jgi:prolyl oligopeptidase
MREMRSQRTLVAGLLLYVAAAPTIVAQTLPAGLSYPATQRGSQVDDYHGSKVADPYRWLEDTDSPETKAWVEAENRVTFGYLATIPERAAIRNRLTQLWNYPKYSAPKKLVTAFFSVRTAVC